jgi:hypothetical protein
MNRPMTHAEIQELLGVYALDALDDDEAEAVARHLDDCPRCRAEVTEHREVAALLSYAGAPAPPQLWDRIAASLEEPPPALQLAPVSSRARHRMVSLRAAAVAFAVAAASIIALGVEVARLDNRTTLVGLPALVRQAENEPDARKVELTSSRPGGPTASAVVLPDGQGFVARVNLAPLPAGQVYQLWGLAQGQLVSLGVLGSNPQQTGFHTVPNTSALAITAEAAPGVAVSHQTPVVQGQIRA